MDGVLAQILMTVSWRLIELLVRLRFTGWVAVKLNAPEAASTDRRSMVNATARTTTQRQSL